MTPADIDFSKLPPVAGLGSIQDAMRIGFSVEDCVARLKRHHWAFRRLHGIFIKRLTAEPVYELKMGFSLHAHLCAEHAAAWRRRVGEMREPPLGLDQVPDAALDVFFDEILAAPDSAALLIGLYEHAIPALQAALQVHLRETNKLVDHPSWRICRFAEIETGEMAAYGSHCIPALVSRERRIELASWTAALRLLLAQAGGLDGSVAPATGPVLRIFSETPHQMEVKPRRDARFRDPYNLGVHAEAFVMDEKFPPAPKALMLYYKRLREIDVPEMMATIIAQTASQPWDYYVDMTRQLWDEARHALMGEVGFVRAGIDWPSLIRVNFTWSLALNTQLTPLERHAVLYAIEQGLMPRTGKRLEWEVGCISGDEFCAMIQDYDWADEVLHTRIGRDWYVPAVGDARKATAHAEECRAKVAIDWKKYREQGLTQHENWWPELYLAACQVKGLEPDPTVLAYQTSYEEVQTDLKTGLLSNPG